MKEYWTQKLYGNILDWTRFWIVIIDYHNFLEFFRDSIETLHKISHRPYCANRFNKGLKSFLKAHFSHLIYHKVFFSSKHFLNNARPQKAFGSIKTPYFPCIKITWLIWLFRIYSFILFLKVNANVPWEKKLTHIFWNLRLVMWRSC